MTSGPPRIAWLGKPGGPSEGGWTIMVVHESQESWETFRDGILMPRLQQGIEGGFQSPPEETAVDIYKLMP